jgi:hypothetical protein
MPKFNKIDNIPAKVFFEILKTKDYQLLKPKPKEKDLETVFMFIYDDYFIKSNNHQANEFLRLTNSIAFLEYKINTIKSTLKFIYYNKTTKEMRLDILKALKSGCDIYIDENLPFTEEVHRVLTIEIGVLNNDLSICKLELKDLVKDAVSKDFEYYDSIIGLSNIHNRSLNSDLTLAEYVAYEKSAEKIINQSKKK